MPKQYRNVVALLFLVVVHVTAATTNLVNSTADAGAGTLRQAIQDSISGDTITFATNLSGATIFLTSGQLVLDKDLTIDASDLPGGVRIDGNANGRIIRVAMGTTVTLSSLTIANGLATDDSGGGIYNSGSLTAIKCFVAGNTALAPYDGGGVYNDGYSGGTLILKQSWIQGNLASYGGGVANSSDGTLIVDQCAVISNSATSLGGGVINYGVLEVRQSTVTGNSAMNGGGGIKSDGTLIVNQSTIVSNWVSYFGGGIYIGNGPSPEPFNSLTNSIVAANAGSTGADIYYSPMMTPLMVGGANIVQEYFDFGHNMTNTLTAVYAAPELAPLDNYGGPTPTMPPLPCSSAIDGCTNGTDFIADQRGFLRPLDGDGDSIAVADIGAVEGVFNPEGPGRLTAANLAGDGSFHFAFSNYGGMPYTVVASTNVSMPLNSWVPLGLAIEAPVGSGQFQFTDPQAANNSQRFYRVRIP